MTEGETETRNMSLGHCLAPVPQQTSVVRGITAKAVSKPTEERNKCATCQTCSKAGSNGRREEQTSWKENMSAKRSQRRKAMESRLEIGKKNSPRNRQWFLSQQEFLFMKMSSFQSFYLTIKYPKQHKPFTNISVYYQVLWFKPFCIIMPSFISEKVI